MKQSVSKMKFKIVLFALVLNGVCAPLVVAFQTQQNQNQSRRLDRLWNPNKLSSNGPVNEGRNYFRRDFFTTDTKGQGDSDEDSSTESSGTVKGKGMRQQNLRPPKINLYTSINNGIGIIGQGFLWLREISFALGSPIYLWIFSIPIVILGLGLMFLPDYKDYSLPIFRPGGVDAADPLDALPPLFNIEGFNFKDFF